jgi:RND family efflux transporter MFP subunit
MLPLLLPVLLAGLLLFPQGLLAHAGHDHGEADTGALNLWPRFETQTRALELVGVLREQGLDLYLDDFATNAPISGVTLEVELEQDERLLAVEEVEPGLYHVHDAALHQSGRHKLVIVVSGAGYEELLLASLEVPELAETHAHGYLDWRVFAAGSLLLFALLLLWRFARTPPSQLATLAALALFVPLSLLTLPQAAQAHAGHDHGDAPASGMMGDQPSRLPDGSLFVPKASQRLLMIRTEPAQPSEIAIPQRLSGHVIPNPNASGRVQAGRAGRITPGPDGLPHLGQVVRKGETLAWLLPVAETLDQGSGEAQLADLDGQIDLTRRQLSRLERLAGAVAQQEVDAARVELESLQRRRAALASGLYQREALFAPADGVISLARVSAGEVVEARQTLFEVIDPQRLWVEAVSWDAELASTVQQARIALPDGKVLQARFIGAGARLRQQAIPLLFELQGELPPLPIETKVEVLAERDTRQSGVLVPREAVVRGNDGSDQVWLHHRAEGFRAQRVEWLPLDGERVAITRGLAPGDRVVTQGAPLLGQIR